MSVSLREFVKQTLLDLTNAVDEAQEESPLSIAPGYVEGRLQIEPQMVEFSVDVIVTEEKTAKGEASVSIPVIAIFKGNAGVDAASSNERMTTQSLKFSIPVYFQGRPIKNQASEE